MWQICSYFIFAISILWECRLLQEENAMKKTLLALLLVAAMLSSVAVTAFAADDR